MHLVLPPTATTHLALCRQLRSSGRGIQRRPRIEQGREQPRLGSGEANVEEDSGPFGDRVLAGDHRAQMNEAVFDTAADEHVRRIVPHA